MSFIQAIEESTGKKAEMNKMPIQDGDVPKTWADTGDLYQMIDFRPSTPIGDSCGRLAVARNRVSSKSNAQCEAEVGRLVGRFGRRQR